MICLHAGHRLFLSDCGKQALLVTNKAELYLWELDRPVSLKSLWWKLFPPRRVQLPGAAHRETAVEALFHTSPVSIILAMYFVVSETFIITMCLI